MAEPQSHLADVSSGFEHHQRTAMSKLMRRYRASTQRGARCSCYADVFVENVLEARPAHCTSLDIYEQLRYGHRSSNRQPSTDVGRRFLPERKASLLAPLADNA